MARKAAPRSTAARKPATVEALSPRPGAASTRVSAAKYAAFRKAILKAIGRSSQGIPFQDLPALVRPLLPQELRGQRGSCSWYTTTVKLDLEARGVLERIPNSRPQRLRRARKTNPRTTPQPPRGR